MRTATRTRGLRDLCLLAMVAILVGCSSTVSTHRASTSPSSASTSSTGQLPRPCSFLTQATAAQVSGDPNVFNQATNVLETESGYVACIFADAEEGANSVAVQIKRVSGGVDSSTLRAAAAVFSRGEPVQPFQPFAVGSVGDEALGESTPGVAFIVFSVGELLVYAGARSTV